MVEWTDEAMKDALDAAHHAGGMIGDSEMRAALDAAVKAQGLDANTQPMLIGYEQGRAEAFEEISEAIKWRWPDAAALVDEMAREGK